MTARRLVPVSATLGDPVDDVVIRVGNPPNVGPEALGRHPGSLAWMFMATEIVCTRCGVDDHLSGTRRDDDLIELHCSACDLTFTRDPRPSCPKCGGFEMEAMPKVLLEKSRGTQMSIQGIQREFLCRMCDEEQIHTRRDGHLPGRLTGSD